MCGIFLYASKCIDETRLHEQSELIRHRGPDNSQSFTIKVDDICCYFKFHRLSINGLTDESNQPLSKKNYVLICNGEIYNYQQLAEEYNIQLQTQSDCEVIIDLYDKFGISMVDKLDGVFSFVLLDIQKRELIIGHDPFGIRSLYMGYDKQGLGFSSELKALNTVTETIKLYKPGCISIIPLSKIYEKPTMTPYYKFTYQVNQDLQEDVIIQQINEKLTQSVQKRLIGERDIGCLLSGGLDSSIIASILCRLKGSKNVKTFSIGFQDSPDILASRKVAKHLLTDHTEIIITSKDVVESLEECICQIESHDVTTIRASVSMYLLSKYIQKQTDVKIIFSGEGSDEASGSYLYFHNAPDEQCFQNECIRLLQDVHIFDALRGDKTTAGCGLEIRVPFFDKQFIEFYMSIDPQKKMPRDGHEKYLLRKAFQNDLPEEIVWRRKDGFSDGVSKIEKPLYKLINEHTLQTYDMVEQVYYNLLFDRYYKPHRHTIPYQWLPKWSGNIKNPSGRLILGNSLKDEKVIK